MPYLPKPTNALPTRALPIASPTVHLCPAIALLLICFAIASLAGCWIRSPEAEATVPLSGAQYQLHKGRFTAISGEQEPLPVPFEPWTVQARVSDLLSLGNRVYLGVNGYGIAEVTLQMGENPDFRYFYDTLIFRYRTLTTLIPEEDSLLCHLYFNKLLNSISGKELKLQGISLLRLYPSTGIYQFLTPPYQEEHPDWEAVGFVAQTAQEFYLQWKYSDDNRTLFYYTRFDLAAAVEQEVGELSYRKSYRFQDAGQQGSAALKELIREIRRILDAPGISSGYQLLIRSEGQSLIRRYEYHPDDFTTAEKIRLITLSGIQREEHLLLLLPDGLLLKAASDSRRIQHLRLPSLPAGYQYRDLLLHGQYLLASWERASFTEVGAAGIFIAAFPLIP